MDLTLAIVLISLLAGLSLFLAIRLSSLNAKSKTFTSDLTAANERIEQLSDDLKQSNAENERQSEALDQATQRNAELSANLKQVAESNANALWLCYLSQVALQMCITVIYDEQQRFDRLKEAYDEFTNRVSEATNERRIRRGITAVLGLIPGANLLAVLGDVLDVFGDAIDAVDVVEDAADVQEIGDLEPTDDNLMGLSVSPGTARHLLGVSAEPHLLRDLETLDQDSLRNYVARAIEHLSELMNSLTDAQRQQRITRIAVNFGKFGIEYYRQTGPASQREEPSDSESKG